MLKFIPQKNKKETEQALAARFILFLLLALPHQ